MTDGDLILSISRLRAEDRIPENIHSRITAHIHSKGQTSLNKWQINAIVRQVMANKTACSPHDLKTLDEAIRRKETNLPGSKLSPGRSSSQLSSQAKASRMPISTHHGIYNKRMTIGDTSASPLRNSGASAILNELNARKKGTTLAVSRTSLAQKNSLLPQQAYEPVL